MHPLPIDIASSLVVILKYSSRETRLTLQLRWLFYEANRHRFEFWNFPVAHTVNNLLAMPESQFWSLSWENPLEKETATHSSILAWRIHRWAWWVTVHGLAKSLTQLSDWASMLCGSLEGRGVWRRMDTCICMAEALSKERQCRSTFKLPHGCTHLTC